tara:strand:- start:107 stop:685 length:579 start_codon:yes stop_codon:yes gene_type:complete
MKISKDNKITKTASTDKTRYMLNGVHLDTEAKQLVSTDGKSLTILKDGDGFEIQEHDKTCTIPSILINEAQKIKGVGSLAELYTIDSDKREITAITNNGEIKGSTLDGPFPNYKQVLPDNDTYSDSFTIAFNPQLLLNIANALGSKGSIKITIKKDNDQDLLLDSPYKITRGTGHHRDNQKSYGILMPLRVN